MTAHSGGQEHLPATAAHVWLWRAPDVDLRPPETTDLATEEIARADRFRHAADRNRHLAARVMLRAVLSRYVDTPPADWRFSADPNGRPEIAGPATGAGLHFNLSHCAGVVACIVARRPEIGVDVEATTTRRTGLKQIADRVLTAEEARWLAAQPADDAGWRKAFLTLWTLKEAYVKARGLGLALALDSFGVVPDSGGGARLADDQADAWRFRRLAWRRADDEWLAATAWGGGGPGNPFTLRDFPLTGHR